MVEKKLTTFLLVNGILSTAECEEDLANLINEFNLSIEVKAD